MRQKYRATRESFLSKTEKTIIRAIIICLVLLTVFQLKSVTDPVEFYLKIAGDIDSPAFKYDQYVQQSNKISVYFSSEPEAPVLVKQNEQILGTIGEGAEIKVESGTVCLDASNVPYPVVVNIICNGKNYSLRLESDKRSFTIELKTNESL